MRRLVLGTAGHIDHGKTSLVRTLTGVDTDRLKEEKERGITIELGFTHLRLPDGTEVGFVDVPGHEKFVRTMIAGASGIDVVLLVIAADEGVMPQTREHLDICSLLGVRDGLVVLNKIDAVERDLVELALEDVRDTLRGTFLDGKAIVPFSAKTGEGKEALLSEISKAADRVAERGVRGPFRMAVDRVFTVKGFGTVVTGTALNGRVRPGDALEVWPAGVTGRVRGVQQHGKDAEEALAGSRTAINLQGVEREQAPRGSVLATAGALAPSHIVDVEYRHLASAPQTFGDSPDDARAREAAFKPKRVRFLSGTQEVVGNLKVLDAPGVKPGTTHLAQVRLEAPVAVRAGDRFVLRTYSPMTTVGGGRVLDNHARKKKPGDAAVERLRALAGDDPAARVAALAADGGTVGLALAELARRLPPGEREDAEKIARAAAKSGLVEVLDGAATRVVSREAFDRIANALLETLRRFHESEPSRPGIARGTLLGQALEAADAGGPDAPGVGDAVLRRLETTKKVVSAGGETKLPGHVPKLDAAQSDLKPAVEETYRAAGLTPPTVKELTEKHASRAKELSAVLALLLREGALVKVSQDLYFHRESLAAIETKLVEWLKAKSRITPLEFKELAGVSRKFMIPLLEHFDAVKLTMRVGEERVLRKR